MNPEQFSLELKKKGIQLTSQQLEQFAIYFKTLVEWNKKMNLTALTSEEDVYLKHFYDSITAAFYVDFNQPIELCDVGAGAGFPSIPLKICFPQLRVTIVDSLKKRIGFLEHLATKLELDHVHFYHDRAETFGRNKKFRQRFDLVIARAVARMSVLSELCLPLVKKNGTFIAMKGSQVEEELDVAQKALQQLGGELKHTYTFTLPEENSERSIVIIDKEKNTPKKYPRKPGTPNRQPIE
ncbi:MAG TPA: 16S rRNA (guanine(527)-N(7))-methyltransferase RsmG [Bacillota bacterium]|nr:16S rRNA (guanine(527)-N(7))-methyltransferase RsmG [Bacillota bacterium]